MSVIIAHEMGWSGESTHDPPDRPFGPTTGGQDSPKDSTLLSPGKKELALGGRLSGEIRTHDRRQGPCLPACAVPEWVCGQDRPPDERRRLHRGLHGGLL